ncbi:CDP-diacylglycerol--serine O-phosphatidyltransferase [Alicyclobacillus acidoterrestris]|uniref:CDP-diacylglycerol--serine O-phosphatidyltransferase n=1 Tax=Alicyclobacillus suci TaxID=2816080 RepID=UPI00118F628F|nr:CDP-diacylglycerol--serine O-phosphatidyltransferase [Alicyclobacillus suci]GEO26701.1 CDP-diacylglycerol--serine O-phosphatidyltransferase [Alicyclobacillus acidoterrestris]
MFIKSIPSLLTLGNLVIGMVAILMSIHGHFNEAALLVVIGMLLDGLDGRVARLLHAESEFGKQLDSLSDLVTFGVAPAAIMYQVMLSHLGLLGAVLAIWFPICGTLRLARFNVETKSSSYFVGLPITAAGGILATMALTRPVLHPAIVILPLGMFILSVLMVSRVRYPNFKRVAFPKSAVVLVPLFVVIVFCAIKFHFIRANWIIFGVLAIYAVYGMLRGVRRHRIRRARGESSNDVEMDGEVEPSSPFREM